MLICGVEGCGGRRLARGWCSKHYMRWRRTGSTEGSQRVPTSELFWSRVVRGTESECWLWVGPLRPHGHGSCRLLGEQIAHRVAYRLAVGEIPPGSYVCHRCNNPPCCNPAHLYVGDAYTNAQDLVARRRESEGFTDRRARLTWAQVCEMRARFAAGGVTQTALAGEYGVSLSQVQRVVRGKQWR